MGRFPTPLRNRLSDRNFDLAVALVAALLSIQLLICLPAWLHFASGDIVYWFIPWYNHVLAYGRFHSLESSFANYNPPYIYLLSLFSLLNRWISAVVILKLVEAPFLCFSAFLFWSICRAMGCSTQRSLLAGWLALVSPEMVANGLKWGQGDNIHTSFILLFIRFMVARRPAWALAALGVALSFKLQTIFLGPVILALLISGALPVWSLLYAALTYTLMMVPAALAGRPVLDLLLIYNQQYGYYPAVAMLVSNPYEFVFPYTEHSLRVANIVIKVGLLVAVIASFALVVRLAVLKQLNDNRKLILALAFCLVLEPYLLPKMHDRYLFAGNAVALLFAMVWPQAGALPGIMLQIASVITYWPFLHGKMYEPRRFFVIPVALVTAALWMLGKQLLTGETDAAHVDAGVSHSLTVT